jgi:hypothetical protein
MSGWWASSPDLPLSLIAANDLDDVSEGLEQVSGNAAG